MDAYRKTAIIVGILFIIGTAAGILSVFFAGSIQGTPGSSYFTQVSANKTNILIAVLLLFTMASATAGTAIWLYPVLKKYNEALALGAVGFRLIESVLGIIGASCLITLLTLSQDFVNAGTSNAPYFQTVGSAILAGHDWITNVAMLLAWCLAAFMYYYIFYRTRLIPRWLTGWGLIGITLSMISSLLVMFGLITVWMPVHSLLNAPIAVQEMIFAAWLIVKGFNPSAIASLSSQKKIQGGNL